MKKLKQNLCAAALLLCMLFTLMPFGVSALPTPEVEYSLDGGTTWEDVDYLVNAVFKTYQQKDAIIRLKRNITLDSSWYGPALAYENITLTLDGNGHTIYRTAGVNGPIFNVNVADSHTILKNITVDGGAVWDDASNVAGRTNSGSVSTGNSYLFVVQDGAKLTLDTGAVLQNNHLSAGYNGAAVAVNSGGSFVMKNGSAIRNNTAAGTGGYGGGGGAIDVAANGSFVMEGGEISGNYASVSGGGITSSGTVEIKDGKIFGNASGNNGGGVTAANGTATLSGGELTQNNAPAGGGACVINGQLNAAGVTISGNTATKGGGVYTAGGTFAMAGNNEISGNTAGGIASNVYLPQDKKIDISGALSNTAPIGITMAQPGIFTNSWSAYMPDGNPAEFFASDSDTYQVQKNGNEAELAEKPQPAEAGPFIVTGGQENTDFVYDNTDKVLRILTSTPIEITAKSNPVTYAKIAVADGVQAKAAIRDLKIDLNECNDSALSIPETASLDLTVKGENLLRSYAAGPGILVDNGAKLTINGTDADTLEVHGAQMASYSDGELSGGMASGFAGIGGQNGGSAYTYTGEIVINGGKIEAHGYGYGAGIGGGDYGSGGTITINGGIVTAVTGVGLPEGWGDFTSAQASGIGASQGQPGGKITITGGTVTASGGNGCAGIGGGTADVTISGGKVTAYGGPSAAGIGGYNQNKGEIKITIGKDAEVTAYAGKNASAIGQGQNTTAKVTLNIENGAVIAAFSKENSNKPAITAVENTAADPAPIINAYITNMTLPLDVPITAELNGDTKNLTVPKGSAGVAFTTGAAGEYIAKTAPEAEAVLGVTYQFIRKDESKATVTSGSALTMEEVKAVAAADFTKEETPEAKADYQNDRLTNLVPGAKYYLEAEIGGRVYSLEGTADEDGYLTHPDFPNFYGVQISIVKLGNGTNTLKSDPQLLQTYQPAVTGISVKSEPSKKSYTIGDAADWTGLAVTLSYQAGEQQYTKDIALTDFAANGVSVSTANGAVLSTSGKMDVTVSCLTFSDSFAIEVAKMQQAALTIEQVSDKTYGDQPFMLEVSGGSGTGARSFAVTSGDSVSVDENGQVTVLKAGESVITVTQAADDNYNEASATVTISIAQKTPEIFAAPAAQRIRRGQMLSEAVLSGGVVTGLEGTVLEGAWTWENDREMTDVGTFSEAAVFTPADENYAPVTVPGISVTVYMPSSGGTPAARYTVTFNTQGGSRIAAKTVAKNTVVSQPADPTKEGYTFEGWYTDADCTKAFDFDTKITENVTLYAKWKENTSAPDDPEKWENPFVDVKENDWFYDAVRYAEENGLFSGMTETTFEPNMPITRGMLVTVLWRSESEPVVNYLMTFDDVGQDTYYGEAIRWASSEGIVKGYSAAEYAPDKLISREELAAIMHRFANYKKLDTSAKGDLAQFIDQAQIAAWARGNVEWAVGYGLLTGKDDGRIDPQGSATRAETAAILMRFLEK